MRAFISYAASDRKWAIEFSNHLEELGIEPWLDVRELLPGDNWSAQIGRALETSGALLVLVSPASAASWKQRGELQFALGSEKFENRVFPVIIDPTDEMPWILNSFPSASGKPAEAARQVARLLALPAPEGSVRFAGSR